MLHPHPEKVRDELFKGGAFFDARDSVQVKYEMLRRTRVDGWPVARAAATYGVSRPTFYAAQDAIARGGMSGLVPRKRGPKHGRKLTDEVVDFVLEVRAQGGTGDPGSLADAVREHFGLRVHPRSIERAIERREKKRR